MPKDRLVSNVGSTCKIYPVRIYMAGHNIVNSKVVKTRKVQLINNFYLNNLEF